MLQLITEHVARGESFAFETTLATKGYARSIPAWQARGYHVTLCFLELPSAEFALERVAQRVRQGGHAVAEDVVRRRFATGRANFLELYQPIVDAWLWYDASGIRPLLLDARQTNITADR